MIGNYVYILAKALASFADKSSSAERGRFSPHLRVEMYVDFTKVLAMSIAHTLGTYWCQQIFLAGLSLIL